MEGDIVIGIDAGGSKTLALAASMDGQVLGRARVGPGNYHVIGFAAASAAMIEAARQALSAAQAGPGQVRAICLGAAGVDRPEDRALWMEWARQAFPGAAAVVVNDAFIVLAAATELNCCGLAVIAGTGSIVYGRDPQGIMARAGGWGFLMGDEGSNYAIGQAALRAITRAADGRGPQTALLPAVLDHWGLPEPSALVGKVYGGTSRHDISRLGRLVEAAANDGDRVAIEILEEAGRELALASRAVAWRLDLRGEISCGLAGAVLLRGPRVRESFFKAAAAEGLALNPVTLVEEPATGAVKLAIGQVNA